MEDIKCIEKPLHFFFFLGWKTWFSRFLWFLIMFLVQKNHVFPRALFIPSPFFDFVNYQYHRLYNGWHIRINVDRLNVVYLLCIPQVQFGHKTIALVPGRYNNRYLSLFLFESQQNRREIVDLTKRASQCKLGLGSLRKLFVFHFTLSETGHFCLEVISLLQFR